MFVPSVSAALGKLRNAVVPQRHLTAMEDPRLLCWTRNSFSAVRETAKRAKQLEYRAARRSAKGSWHGSLDVNAGAELRPLLASAPMRCPAALRTPTLRCRPLRLRWETRAMTPQSGGTNTDWGELLSASTGERLAAVRARRIATLVCVCA